MDSFLREWGLRTVFLIVFPRTGGFLDRGAKQWLQSITAPCTWAFGHSEAGQPPQPCAAKSESNRSAIFGHV